MKDSVGNFLIRKSDCHKIYVNNYAYMQFLDHEIDKSLRDLSVKNLEEDLENRIVKRQTK